MADLMPTCLAARPLLACSLAFALVGCGRACGTQEVAAKPAPKPAAPPPAPPPPPPPKPVSADDLPARESVGGDGIKVTLTADGLVKLETTSLWNASLDTIYDNCDYYRNALPVIRKQVSEERAKVLDKVCVPPEPPKSKAKPKTKPATPPPKQKQ